MQLLKALPVLLFWAVALAGCADESMPDAVDVDFENLEGSGLALGKGAIAGLLVDDRFRPIQLIDDPITEFQSSGFILLQETGQQIQSNENGEFAFVNTEPGSYTLRANIAGHEATPQRVQVQEGEFSEITVLARRIASLDNVIVTQEFSAFAPCFSNFVMYSFAIECTNDLSGDTDRAAWYPDLNEFNDTAHYIVMEALFNNEAPESTAYDFVNRAGPTGTDYASAVLRNGEGRYAKLHLPIGEQSPDPTPVGGGCDAMEDPDTFCPYYPYLDLQVIIFGRGYLNDEIRSGYEPVNDAMVDNVPCNPSVPFLGFACANHATMRRGVGGAFGTQATYMMSLFLFDPEADGTVMHESDYCALCNPEG